MTSPVYSLATTDLSTEALGQPIMITVEIGIVSVEKSSKVNLVTEVPAVLLL